MNYANFPFSIFNFQLFFVPLHSILKGMVDNTAFIDFVERIKVRRWGKYVVTIGIFLFVYIFVGDQSMTHFFRRGREIRHLEEQRDMYRKGTDEAQRRIQMLNNRDSLERYAREHYFMHEKGEDIYLVDE